MRSPNQSDRVLTLPLRVNTSLYTDVGSEPMAAISEEQTHPSQLPSTPSSTATTLMDWSPTSPSAGFQRRLNRPHAPTPILTRSPIRKRPRSTRHHITVRTTTPLSPTTLRTRLQYANSLQHLRAPLVPLISVSNGLPHPFFPTTLLQYHLLTHDQLDSLARWYHQVDPPLDETFMYPAWIPAWTSLHPQHTYTNVVLGGTSSNAQTGAQVDLETKRRRFGRFIGLRGCESPTTTTSGPPDERPDELARRMEREWRRALERAEDEERAWEKSWRGRW